MSRFSSRIAAALIALAMTAPAAFAETGQLVVNLTGLKEHKGQVMIALYDEASYENGQPVQAAMAPVAGAEASHVFKDLAPGRYGMKLFHDVNGDGKMGTNPFGMPTEPYAFSNNAKGSFGPAGWDKAGFDVGAGETVQAISFE